MAHAEAQLTARALAGAGRANLTADAGATVEGRDEQAGDQRADGAVDRLHQEQHVRLSDLHPACIPHFLNRV